MKPAKMAGFAVLVIAAFLAGVWFKGRSGQDQESVTAGRRIHHYICPMHPQYTSAKPGDCPSCGMRLVPVYENEPEEKRMDASAPGLPAGVIRISPEKQQIIGVQTGKVERTSGTRTIRVLGRVAVDETRIYRVNAAIAGWIRDIYPNTVGSLVHKDQPLASYYAPEFIGPQQAFLYALGALDRFQDSGKETPEQIALTKANIQQAADALRNMGMNDIQIEEMRQKRELTQRIKIYSPTDGFILTRNVSPGLRFEASTELYQIADLSRIWILADMFENEAHYFKPGARARISHPAQETVIPAQVSDVLPQFDAATRTLKVRLEAANRNFALRPDMFVDVEFPVNVPPSLSVPAEAVLDTGLRKTVFVDLGNGYFEPRRIETGWHMENRIEVTRGLMEGERIVLSGNFLIDSESRLKAAAMGSRDIAVLDPVCGMQVDPATAGTRQSKYNGRTYYFCSDECKDKFDRNPEKFAGK